MKIKIKQGAKITVGGIEYTVGPIWFPSSGPTLQDCREYDEYIRRGGLRSDLGFVGALDSGRRKYVQLSEHYSSESDLHASLENGFEVLESKQSLEIVTALIDKGFAS